MSLSLSCSSACRSRVSAEAASGSTYSTAFRNAAVSLDSAASFSALAAAAHRERSLHRGGDD